MNDNNNGDNDKIRIKRYAVLYLMGLRFYFLPSLTSPSFMVVE